MLPTSKSTATRVISRAAQTGRNGIACCAISWMVLNEAPLTNSTDSFPIVDIASLRRDSRDLAGIGAALDRACCEFGFFYITGHGISPALSARMMTLAHEFFGSPLEQ